jgi:hypothetical protein
MFTLFLLITSEMQDYFRSLSMMSPKVGIHELAYTGNKIAHASELLRQVSFLFFVFFFQLS